MMNHPIENIMQSSMDNIKQLADVNTVIGSPLLTDDNTMILPVSKVCLGLLVGGGEYSCMSPVKKSGAEASNDGKFPFAGATAVGMCLTPLAFLAVQNGTVRVLPAKQECAADRLVDLIPQTLAAAERLVRELVEKSDGNQKGKSNCGCKGDKEKGGNESNKDKNTATGAVGATAEMRSTGTAE